MTTEPIVVTVTVGCDVATAFELWTKEVASWFPVQRHSLGHDEVVDVQFEEHVGGRLYEIWRDGSERTWAEIERWEPPHAFVLAWHPGYDAEQATHVEVSFVPLPDGGTDVRLEHRDWDRLGSRAGEARASYANGWPTVLGHYVDGASSRIH